MTEDVDRLRMIQDAAKHFKGALQPMATRNPNEHAADQAQARQSLTQFAAILHARASNEIATAVRLHMEALRVDAVNARTEDDDLPTISVADLVKDRPDLRDVRVNLRDLFTEHSVAGSALLRALTEDRIAWRALELERALVEKVEAWQAAGGDVGELSDPPGPGKAK